MYTVAEENYIKSIYHLQRQHKSVHTNDLAAELNTRAASATDMIKKLEAKGLLKYEKYYGCSLTKSGKKLALNIIRRHRLWEFFLSEKLGFGWEEVHAVAEQLEHVQSDLLTDKLDAYLGFPRFDPHGDPIPDTLGNMAAREQTPLSLWTSQAPAEVCGVGSQDESFLEMLSLKQLEIGCRLTVLRHFNFDKTVELQLATGSSFTISEMLAKNIFVKPVEV